MERETNNLETPVRKHQVVIHAYLTGREFEYVQAPLLQAMSVRPGLGGRDMQLGELDVSKVQDSTHRLIEKIVVSVDGVKEGVLDTVLDMHHSDYEFVVDAINALSKKN